MVDTPNELTCHLCGWRMERGLLSGEIVHDTGSKECPSPTCELCGERYVESNSKCRDAHNTECIKIIQASKITAEKIREYINIQLQRDKRPSSGALIDMIVRGVEESGRFYCIKETDELVYFDGKTKRYCPDGPQRVAAFVEETIRMANAMSVVQTGVVNEVEGHVRRISFVSLDQFDNERKTLIPCSNGIYDITSKKLLPYSKEYKFLTTLNVKYNPSASCPKFLKYLDDVCVDQDGNKDMKMHKTLIQIFAYCLWRGYPLRKVFFLIGGGSNGKGVYTALLQLFLGNENVANRSIVSLSDNRFASADLYRKYANISGELTVGELKNFDLLKALVSGTDRIQAERKFGQPFGFLNFAKPVISTNAPPKTRDSTDGFYSRISLIRFWRQFFGTDAIKDLLTTMSTEEELSGILNMAIVELESWLNGDIFKPEAEFANEMSVDETRELYERLSDSVAAFRYDELEITGDEIDAIKKDVLFHAYRNYCKAEKMGAVTETKFWIDFRAQTVGSVFNKRSREKDTRSYMLCGVKLKNKPIDIYDKIESKNDKNDESGKKDDNKDGSGRSTLFSPPGNNRNKRIEVGVENKIDLSDPFLEDDVDDGEEWKER